MKFLHVADLHLDRNFEGLGNQTELTEGLLTMNERVLENIVTVAIDSKVDLLILAGDTFHQSRPSLKTQHHFFSQLQRLAAEEIPVFMIFGNHDYYQPEKYWFPFPDNLQLFTSETVETKELVTKSGERVAISGFSYQHPWITEEKASDFPKRYPVDIHLGIYHGEEGRQNRYAPFTAQQLLEKGYDYWALGHIHVPTVVQGTPPMIYPGTPQGHSQKETQVTGVELVTIDNHQLKQETLAVAEALWQVVEISLQGVKELAEVLPTIQKQIPEVSAFQLLVLQLQDSQHLDQELDYQVESGELQDLLNQTGTIQGLHICQITLEKSVEGKQPIQASQALLKDILTGYQQPVIFEDLLVDAYQHRQLHQLLSDNPQLMTEILQKAEEEVTEVFAFSEEKL